MKGQIFHCHILSRYFNPMSRPLRMEYPGALYHVTARCNAREKLRRRMTTGSFLLISWSRSRKQTFRPAFRRQLQRRKPRYDVFPVNATNVAIQDATPFSGDKVMRLCT